MCSTTDCSDVMPAVNCSTLTSTKMDIQLANVRWVQLSVLCCSLEQGVFCVCWGEGGGLVCLLLLFCGFCNWREHFPSFFQWMKFLHFVSLFTIASFGRKKNPWFLKQPDPTQYVVLLCLAYSVYLSDSD